MQYRFNELTIEAYTSGTTRITTGIDELDKAQNITFSTGYPGGLYLDAQFRVHRDIVKSWALAGAQRVVFRNGLSIVYEGYVNDLIRVLEQGQEYIDVPLVGAWSKIMMTRRWRKHWANDNVDDRTWVWQTGTTGGGDDKVQLDRNQRLRFTPKAELFGNGDIASVKYTMPTGEVIRKIVCDFDFLEGGQSWELDFYDATNGQEIIRNTDGSGSKEYDLGTAVNAVVLRFVSKAAAQTPTSDGAYFGEVTNLVVFGGEAVDDEVDLTQLCEDVLDNYSDLNSSEAYLSTITQTAYDYAAEGDITGIVPFVMDSFPTLADILTEMAGYGDDNLDSWAVGLYHSEKVASPDGKPVLFCELQPALTDYDYVINYGDENITAPLSIDENYDELYNWIVVEYQDENGWTQYITPDDDANLKDTTSIADYDQRDGLLRVGDATVDMATAYGRRYLKRHKDPQWKVNQPIQINGYITKKDGSTLPSSQIESGKRLRIKNYLNDLSGDGLTMLITRTQYTDDNEVCSLSFGKLDSFLLAPFKFPALPYSGSTPPAGGGGGGGGGGGIRPIGG